MLGETDMSAASIAIIYRFTGEEVRRDSTKIKDFSD